MRWHFPEWTIIVFRCCKNAEYDISFLTRLISKNFTEFGEHADDGGLVGPVDDVVDVGRRGEAEGVHADPSLALRGRVEQRSLASTLKTFLLLCS